MRPELDKRCRPQLKATNDSYRVDETYIKIKKHWYYLYRAVDSTGATLDFMLSPTRDADAAERFFRQVLQGSQSLTSRDHRGQERRIPTGLRGPQQTAPSRRPVRLRQCKYLNNVIEQDHRFVKRRVNPGLGFGAFATAQRTIQGYEAMHMLPKASLRGSPRGCPRPEPGHQPAVWGGNASSPPPLRTLPSVLQHYLKDNVSCRCRRPTIVSSVIARSTVVSGLVDC